MLYTTIAEYDTAITNTQDAISRIITQGESYKIGTPGGSRETTEIKLRSLREHLALLMRERNSLSDPSGVNDYTSAVPGW